MDSVDGDSAVLHGEDAHHLTRVLRVQPGQQFEITDNRSAWLAEVTEAHANQVRFRVVEPVETPPPLVTITLCAALIKFDRFEWLVEKATELGVARIVPFDAARTEKGLFEAAPKRTERWRKIAKESAQQSRRTTLPEVAQPVKFAAALETPAAWRCFLDEGEAPPLLTTLPQPRPADGVAVLLGPEGGWTEDERQRALRAGWRAASLGPQILRAETAAAAALAVITAAWIAYNEG